MSPQQPLFLLLISKLILITTQFQSFFYIYGFIVLPFILDLWQIHSLCWIVAQNLGLSRLQGQQVIIKSFDNTNLNSKQNLTTSLPFSIMNAHKRQTIESLIVNESGSQTLDLNDLVLGYEGARIVGAMIPQYHQGIRHIRVNGNNIDAQGFQIIFSALLHCPHLKSIEAEWNNMGSSDIGLASLCHLAKTLQYLQFIDLKNNRIGHHLSGFLAELLELNKRNLKVIDLRWNDLGELGAKALLNTVGLNKNIKFLGLEDNRISTGTLMEIQSFLRINSGKGVDEDKILRHSSSQGAGFAPNHSQGAGFAPTHSFFPISGDEYQGMDIQVKSGQIRSKIDLEQKEAQRYAQKIEVDIQKVMQKMKLRGAQINEMQLKYDSILGQNQKITSELREAERVLALERERAFGVQRSLNQQKSQMRSEKYKINNNIQNVMEKFTQRNQRELEELQMVMNQKLDRLNIYLKERLHQKRTNREKLGDLKEDIMKFKMNKEDSWNKGASNMSSVINANINKGAWEEEYFAMEEMISAGKSTIQAESKKGDYMSEELNKQIIRALKKQRKLEDSIFDHQNKIKSIHSEMTHKNIDIEKNLARAKLTESKILDKDLAVEMQKRYIKYIQSQSQISVQIENLKQDQLNKANRVSEDTIEMRTADVERALRAQQAQNKMIKNQYEKMMSQLQTISKKTIQVVLYE